MEQLLGVFSKHIGVAWAFEAEVYAILNAQVFYHEFGFTNVVIETASAMEIIICIVE